MCVLAFSAIILLFPPLDRTVRSCVGVVSRRLGVGEFGYPWWTLTRTTARRQSGQTRRLRTSVVNCGSIVPAPKCLVIVLRDRPVRREISRIDSFSRQYMRQFIFKSPMCITPLLPVAHRAGGRVTWLNFQWKIIR